jgi:zinc protease
MRRLMPAFALLLTLGLAACATGAEKPIVVASEAPPPAPAAGVATVADLVRQVDIPYERFTLDNGLRVLVHTDRKAPIVGVTVYYGVGSKNEPKGRTGFAHLFEHLMFGGSENVPNFDEPLVAAGSTATNGSTWFDRTNYVETVPTGALDLALFMEADRMGHLLGAVTQEKLDAQRGVVQNEKRQGDNQPYGLVEYAEIAALFPPEHPYGHSTIGSMSDLDAASLEDVKTWFRDHYAPNNAVLVLAGDIDAATARAKVEKYFGGIPRGPAVKPVEAPIPTLPARKDELMRDRVATTRLYREWVVPGLGTPDNTALDVAAGVLGGLSSSRLDNSLVRQEQVAVSVSAGVQTFAQVSFFTVTVDVKPGVDAETVSKRLDALIEDYVKNGPTADEVNRYVTSRVASEIADLENVGGFSGKAVALAEGELYSNDPAQYKKELAELATATPEKVRAAMQKWLTRPVWALRVEPGERGKYEESGRGGTRTGVISSPAFYRGPDGGVPASAAPSAAMALPNPGPTPPIDFPDVETATLSNGIKVHLARRATIPAVRLAVRFDAGGAADPKDQLGINSLMLALLDEGTKTRNSVQIAEEQERLGASIYAGSSIDGDTVSMYSLTANLAPSLDLLADIVRNPAFAPAEVERIKATQLAGIASEKTQPSGMAQRALPAALYGPEHPYAVLGAGDPEAVAKLTPQDLAAFHERWIRPDNAEIFVVGDTRLEQLLPLLQTRFGAWQAPASPKGTKDLDRPIPAPKPRIILIDRPQSPQSVILGGEVLDRRGGDDLVALLAANNVLADDFLSRINMDIREKKAWSYGVSGRLNLREGPIPYVVSAPVQQDKTGPALAAILQDYRDFLGRQPINKVEFERVVKGNVLALPGLYETSLSILGQMQQDAIFGRPSNYVETLAGRYKAVTPEQLMAAARQAIDPAKMVWIVVGDAAKVRPQLKALGLPVEVATPR